jgi:hypothetical protein
MQEYEAGTQTSYQQGCEGNQSWVSNCAARASLEEWGGFDRDLLLIRRRRLSMFIHFAVRVNFE